MSQGRVPGWPPWLLELLKGACKRFRSLWFPWKLVSPPSGRPIRLLCSVFSDFFVIYSQNGFFLEASGSLQATHFFKLCHNSTSLFRVKGVCLSGIHLHFPLSTPPWPASRLWPLPVSFPGSWNGRARPHLFFLQ